MQRLGRFEIIEELGRGAMGAVYRGRDPVIDRTVAIKTILVGFDSGDTEGYRSRFFREAQAAGRLSHPGIVTIHDIGEDEATKTPYIVMEHIAGRTLENLVSESPGRLPVETTLDLVQQVAEALHYAHSEGIVHRDIKPANILVTPQGRAKITDFGVARLRVSQMTVAGEVLGTPSYMSPEQVEGARTDGRADLFSLGVILYWMLTGERPFKGENPGEVMFKIAYKEHAPAAKLNPALPPDLDCVLDRVLAKKPEDRYPSAREFSEDLESIRQGRALRSPARASVAPAAAPEMTVVATPRERKTDIAAAIEKTVLVPPASPAGAPRSAAPVVVVNWERVGELLRMLGRQTWAVTLFLARHAARFAQSLPGRARTAAALARRGWERAKALPRPAQYALAGTVVALGAALAVVFTLALRPTATLQVNVFHDALEGTVTVWVGEDQVLAGKLAGETTKRLGVFERTEGVFSEAVKVPPGKHVVRVQVQVPAAGFEATRETQTEFSEEEEKTLVVRCNSERGSLRLSWQ